MTVAAGTRIGVYEVVAQIGAGGMGEVYRAHDTRLNRDVALKVLPEAFSRDMERMARFEREAKVLASLNHPNIAAIYGFEESGPIRALVMELVEGPTLADRIRSGAIPIDEALLIARQIADAIEYAHDNNVIHRDLKPANLKVKADGTAKVLDFGLAKAMSDEIAEADMANSPTLSMAATRQGVILGTAAYMSPEQAKGKSVDRRTDVWAFGCVLFEMLTGKVVFSGDSVAETLASVMKEAPPFESLPKETPAAIQMLLRRCLDRNLRRRLVHVGEARVLIEGVISGEASDAQSATAVAATIAAAAPAPIGRLGSLRQSFGGQAFLGWAVAGVLAIVAGLALWRPWMEAPAAPVVTRFTFSLPQGELLNASNGGLAISPDGRYVAYAATPSGGTRQLFLRAMDRGEAIPFPGTENAGGLFFSPDSQWIGFTANGKLEKVLVTGGTPIVLCDRLHWNTASWGPDGNIYFGEYDDLANRLMRIPAAGGTPEAVANLAIKAGEEGIRWVEALPGGESILVVNGGTQIAYSDDATILVVSLRTGQQKTLVRGGTSPHYLLTGFSSGELVYAQGGRLLAAPFDTGRIEVTGPATPVMDGVYQGTAGYAGYALSKAGSLAYVNGGLVGSRSQTTVNWVDRAGTVRRLRDDLHVFSYPSLSPDGHYLAIRNGDASPAYNMWISDLARGTLMRLTFVGPDERVLGPAIWTPDAKRVIYALLGGQSKFRLMSRSADGTGAEEELLSGSAEMEPLTCSPDGKFLVFYRNHSGGGGRDLYLLSLIGKHRERPLIESTTGNKVAAQISPDGRWMAYGSDESGRGEVYVQPFPDLGGKWQVSVTGGREPRWSRDGRQIFYWNGTKMMVVDVQTQNGFVPSIPRLLFGQPSAEGPGYAANYDVAPDGRFLMLMDAADQSSQIELRMVLNWTEELKRRVPTGTK